MHIMHDEFPELRGLELDQLLYLDALLRLRSVTRTAAEAGLTQSAMSHALRRLRDRFDDPILVRVGSSMAPTPFAEQLRPRLRAALVGLQQALGRSGPFEPAEERRTFRIASPDLFDLLVLPTLIRRLAEAGTGIGLRVSSYGRADVRQALTDGDLDLALVPVLQHAPQADHEGFMRKTLFHDGFRCFLRPGHPAIASWGLDSWLQARHLLVSPSGRPKGLVDRALEEHGRSRTVAVQVEGFGVAPALVAGSDLVLTAPASLARLTRPMGIVDLDPPIPLPSHGIAMLWHRRFGEEAGLRWLMAQLQGSWEGLVRLDATGASASGT